MIKTAYDKVSAETYDAKRFDSPSGQVIHNIELGLLRDALKYIGTEKDILEVGCGTGRLLIEVCQAGYIPYGLDASIHMLVQCAEKIKDIYSEVGFVFAEAGKIPFEKDSLDFLYSIRVLNQTGSNEYALSIITEMIRVAKPGGYVLVEFMNFYRKNPFGRRTYLSPKDVVISQKANVRLRPNEVIAKAEVSGATPIWFRGAFFLGMTSFHLLPVSLLNFVSRVDQLLSKIFPQLCSRGYILFQKNEKQK